MRQGSKAPTPVVRWQATLKNEFFGISVVSLSEIRYGIRKVEERDKPFGELLRSWYARIVSQPDIFRILPVDQAIAELAADYRAAYGTPQNDALIAATAKVHHLTLATRNTVDFEKCGIELINPWLHPG